MCYIAMLQILIMHNLTVYFCVNEMMLLQKCKKIIEYVTKCKKQFYVF